MSTFYGVVSGQAKNNATRRGNKRSGLVTQAATWRGAVEVSLDCDEAGNLRYRIRETPWHGHGKYKEIAEGVFE